MPQELPRFRHKSAGLFDQGCRFPNKPKVKFVVASGKNVSVPKVPAHAPAFGIIRLHTVETSWPGVRFKKLHFSAALFQLRVRESGIVAEFGF
jgi:hypothetical protein